MDMMNMASVMRSIIISGYNQGHCKGCKRKDYALWMLSGIEQGHVEDEYAEQGIGICSEVLLEHHLVTLQELEAIKENPIEWLTNSY